MVFPRFIQIGRNDGFMFTETAVLRVRINVSRPEPKTTAVVVNASSLETLRGLMLSGRIDSIIFCGTFSKIVIID
jgi:hypothetical protein